MSDASPMAPPVVTELTARDELLQLRAACARSNAVICNILGQALGYPRFVDDPTHFPDATEADGVCVGDHVAETIAMEAAWRIASLREQGAALRAQVAVLRARADY